MVNLSDRTMSPLTADDLSIGDWIEPGPWTVGADEIIEFAQRWDPLPIHVDPAAAAQGPFTSLVASGIHTLAIYQRLVAIEYTSRLDVVAGKGIDRMRLPRPVRPGARLVVRNEITAIDNRPDPQDRSEVQTHGVMTDQHGHVVLDIVSVMIVRRRSSTR